MDENKAIKIIRQEMEWESKSSTLRAFEKAIKALEEIQLYRAIGTPEECRAAKRPRIIGNAMICPSCPRCFKSASPTYCPSCGQMIDWGNEE